MPNTPRRTTNEASCQQYLGLPAVTVIWPTVPDAYWAALRPLGDSLTWQPDTVLLDQMSIYSVSRTPSSLLEVLLRAQCAGRPVAITA